MTPSLLIVPGMSKKIKSSSTSESSNTLSASSSALSFVQLFYDNLVTPGLSVTKELAFFWTMVDKRERTSLYDVYEGMFKSLDYSVLNTRLPDSKRFRRELSENRKAVFRSTIFPSDPNLLRGSGIKELSDEICEIIKT